jgi:hypothetical protein
MIIETMVDNILGNPRGNDDGGNPRAILLKGKAVLVVTDSWNRVSRGNGRRRNGMIEEASVLIPSNNENTAFPDR